MPQESIRCCASWLSPRAWNFRHTTTPMKAAHESSFIRHLFKNRALRSAITLLLSLYGGSCCQGKVIWKCPWTCCRIPFMILKALLSSTGAQTLVSTSVFSKSVFHSLSNCWFHSSCEFRIQFCCPITYWSLSHKSSYRRVLLKDLGL